MKSHKKYIPLFLVLLMLCATVTACTHSPVETSPLSPAAEDIAILYTNDIHSYIDGPLGYDSVAAIKQALQQQYAHVLLVDAGDHSQGTAYGSMDEGWTITSLMNAAGYDAATLGNHEFDYGMSGCMRTVDHAEFPYVSCNFYHESEGVRGENVLESFVSFPCGKEVIAFVGITTPESFEPAYFLDENGICRYNISGGSDGTALYADVQQAIDEAKAAGATRVIALGHVGNEYVSQSWSSPDIIANTVGLSAFIDGHSHTVVKGETIADRGGNDVLLTQTGEYFSRIGLMVLDGESGEVSTDFIEYKEKLAEDGKTVTGYELASALYNGTEIPSDPAVAELEEAWISELDTLLGERIGLAAVTLDNYDGETRLVRQQETNSGDFAADALYYLFDDLDMGVDVAIVNGGGIRNKRIAGEVSYKTCKDIHTFGNVACLTTVTGQQLLDALEWGVRGVGTGNEIGAFLQVAGLTYRINAAIPSTVGFDGNNIWTGGPSAAYRVYDVQVYNRETQRYEPLDPNRSYRLAGYNYILRNLGDGFAMFDGAENVLDYVMEDYMVLANYIRGFEQGNVDAANSPLLEKYPNLWLDYSAVTGCGRIQIAMQ